MALASYTDLTTAVAAWMNRANDAAFVAAIPDFIVLAEARIARDVRIRKQVTTVTLSTVADTQTVTLPTDFLEIENITLISDPNVALSVITPEIMDVRFPAAYRSGVPKCYALLGDSIVLGPTPDAVYSISLDYYARFNLFAARLSGDTTNWLLTNHPGVYLNGVLCEAALFQMDEQRAAIWDTKYRAEVQQLNDSDDAALRSGSAMRVRAL